MTNKESATWHRADGVYGICENAVVARVNSNWIAARLQIILLFESRSSRRL
jgi:hypothetical protein